MVSCAGSREIPSQSVEMTTNIACEVRHALKLDSTGLRAVYGRKPLRWEEISVVRVVPPMQRWPPLFDVLWLRWGFPFLKSLLTIRRWQRPGWLALSKGKCSEVPWEPRDSVFLMTLQTVEETLKNKRTFGDLQEGSQCSEKWSDLPKAFSPEPTYSWSGLLSISPCCLNTCLWCISWTVLGSLKSRQGLYEGLPAFLQRKKMLNTVYRGQCICGIINIFWN